MKKTVGILILVVSQLVLAKNIINIKDAKSSTEPHKVQFKSEDGKVNFTAVGRPAMIKIIGNGPGPAGELTYQGNKISGTFVFDLKKLDTGIELRDDHMKNKYLEVNSFPQAKLEIKDIILPKSVDQLDSNEFSTAVKGLITIHGKTNPIDVDLVVHKEGNSYNVSSNFSVKIMDYLAALPSYMGLKVAEDVQVKVETKSK